MWAFLDRAAGWATRAPFYMSVALLVALMVIGAADVVLTQGFRHSIPGAVELSEAALAVLIFLGLPQVQRVRGHIVIDLFTARLSPSAGRVALVISSLVELAFFVALGWAAWALTVRSLLIDERATGYLAFPLYPGKALVCAGVILASIEIFRQVVLLATGSDAMRREGAVE